MNVVQGMTVARVVVISLAEQAGHLDGDELELARLLEGVAGVRRRCRPGWRTRSRRRSGSRSPRGAPGCATCSTAGRRSSPTWIRLATLLPYAVAVAVVGLLIAAGVSLLVDAPEAGRWLAVVFIAFGLVGATVVAVPMLRR